MIGTSPQLLKVLFTFQRRENNYYVIKQVKLFKKDFGEERHLFPNKLTKVNISVQLQKMIQQQRMSQIHVKDKNVPLVIPHLQATACHKVF